MFDSSPRPSTAGELLDQLGGIPVSRVWLDPAPGTATESDVVEAELRENRLCELADGVLVEKAPGFRESVLSVVVASAILSFVRELNLGLVTGADGTYCLAPGLIRIPDAAFVSWVRVPGRRIPREPIPAFVPDLVVQVLRTGNTPSETARKLREYFTAGVRVVWIVDPDARTLAVYTAPESVTILDETQAVDGGELLPRFSLPLRDLFSRLEQGG